MRISQNVSWYEKSWELLGGKAVGSYLLQRIFAKSTFLFLPLTRRPLSLNRKYYDYKIILP